MSDAGRPLPRNVAASAGIYFAAVFAVGFALGSVRILVAAPAIGELPAVLLELPFMLWVSWGACGACVRRFEIAGRSSGLAMGAGAFTLLIVAETVLGFVGFGRSLTQQAGEFVTLRGLVGLAGQIGFGIMPAIRAGRK